jgi:hypothetical protein
MTAEIVQSLERARELCAEAGDDSLRCDVLSALAFLYVNQVGSKAPAICAELLKTATRIGDIDMIGRAHFWRSFWSFWKGDFPEALNTLEKGYQLPLTVRSKQELSYGGWQTLTRSIGALALLALGYPEKAILRNQEALVMERQRNDSWSMVPILFWSSQFNRLIGDLGTAYEHAEEALRLAREHDLAALTSGQQFFRDCTLVQMGRVEEGLAEAAGYPAQVGDFVRTPVGSVIFPALANCYLAARRPDEGLAVVAQGLENIERNEVRHSEAELRRIKGELLLLGKGTDPEAEALLSRGD